MDSATTLIRDTGSIAEKSIDDHLNRQSLPQTSTHNTSIETNQNISPTDDIRDAGTAIRSTSNKNSFVTNNDIDQRINLNQVLTISSTSSNPHKQLNNSTIPTVISESDGLVPLGTSNFNAHKLIDKPVNIDVAEKNRLQQASNINKICDTDLNDRSIDHIKGDVKHSKNQKPITGHELRYNKSRELDFSSFATSDQNHLESVEFEQLINEPEHISDIDNSSSTLSLNHQTFQLDDQPSSDRSYSPSYLKRFRHTRTSRFLNRIRQLGNGSSPTWIASGGMNGSINNNDDEDSASGSHLNSEDKDLLTGTSKYSHLRKRKQNIGGRTFWGSYRYKRIGIVMAVFKKLYSFIISRSTLALFGAFLIHITLGTVYTLSNINSYLTSYMRKHGTPDATYGGSMWISSSYAVGQGFSMVLGGYLAKRFSARLSCIIGCILHSGSIMSTSISVDYGRIPVLLTYGLLPGFGCGLAYMTPMTNGFGWFPNRKGLVAGTILAGFGIGTFVFNMAQTAYVNPKNLSPPKDADGYFTQESILMNVPHLFTFIGSIYATMQFIGCCLLFKPPNDYYSDNGRTVDEKPILVETEMPLRKAIRSREFLTLFFVFGLTNQGVLFVNSMLKEYGQIFIGNDMYLAWTGSMASIANSLGRLVWGMAIDRYSFSRCFTAITLIFGSLMFIMPFEVVLSSKLLYLLCTLGIFGSFSGWMSTYPVHISRVFGVTNSGMVYGLIFVSQAFLAIFTALGAHYLIDHYSRFVPFFCVTFLEVLGLLIYHIFYKKRSWN